MARVAKQRLADASEYERHIARLFEHRGYHIQWPQYANRNYDFLAIRDGRTSAVEVKSTKSAVGLAHVQRMDAFLANEGREFAYGMLVSRNGFAKTTLPYEQNNPRLLLKVPRGDLLIPIEEPHSQRHLGFFAAKGGTGKTSLCAYMALALAVQSNDVFLVDLNPAENLWKLLGIDGLYVEAQPGTTGTTITAFNAAEWKRFPYVQSDCILYDFPQLFGRSAILERAMAKVDTVVAPLEFTPLSIGNDGHVFDDTIAAVRARNREAKIVFVANKFRRDRLRPETLHAFDRARERHKSDAGVRFTDPQRFAIPDDSDVANFGHRILDRGGIDLRLRDLEANIAWRNITRLAHAIIGLE